MGSAGQVESSFVWAGRYDQHLVFDMHACHLISRIKIRTLSSRAARDIHRASLHTSNSPTGPWTAVMPRFIVAPQTYSWNEFNFNATQGRYWKLYSRDNYGDRSETGFNEIGFWGQECPGST